MSSNLFFYQAGSAALGGASPARPAPRSDRSPAESRQPAEAAGESGLLSDALLQFRETVPSGPATGLGAEAVFSPEQARQTLEATRHLILRQAPAAARVHADLRPGTYTEWA